MRLKVLHENINPNQMNDIIKDIKLQLKLRPFSKAVYHEMIRYGLGENPDIFNEITAEMRRRSAIVRKNGGRGRHDYTAPGTPYYKYMVQRAIKYAKDRHQQALIASPDLDVDIGQAAGEAADKFGVSPQEVLNGL